MVYSAGIGYRKLALYGRKQRVFDIGAYPGCFFVTDGHIDVRVGAIERFWRVDVPFGSFGQIWLREIGIN